MEAAPVEIDRDLVDLLEELRRPAKQAAREIIVLELYRGRGIEWTCSTTARQGARGVHPVRFGNRASRNFQLDSDELQRELDTFKKL